MAKATAANPRLKTKGRNIVLTPKLFAELDTLARKSGCVIEVKRAEEMEGAWGRYSPWVIDVYRDERITDEPGCIDEVSAIEIANSVDVDALYALYACRRPEIDWTAIPENKLYEFVVLHEIGHRLNNFCQFDFMVSRYRGRPDERYWYRALLTVNEVLADRYAWKALFPQKKFPVASHPKEHLDKLETWINTLKDDFKLGRITVKPLPMDPGKYVPVRHVKNGIPWALKSKLSKRTIADSTPLIEAVILMDSDKRVLEPGEIPTGKMRSIGVFPNVELAEAAGRGALNSTPNAIGFTTRTARPKVKTVGTGVRP